VEGGKAVMRDQLISGGEATPTAHDQLELDDAVNHDFSVGLGHIDLGRWPPGCGRRPLNQNPTFRWSKLLVYIRF
jgi:hypothetical protein